MKVKELRERLQHVSEHKEVKLGIRIQDGHGIMYHYLVEPLNVVIDDGDVKMISDLIDSEETCACSQPRLNS